MLAASIMENFDELYIYNSFSSNEKKHMIHLENGLKGNKIVICSKHPSVQCEDPKRKLIYFLQVEFFRNDPAKIFALISATVIN